MLQAQHSLENLSSSGDGTHSSLRAFSKTLTIALLLCATASCASTQVHLFTQALSEHEILTLQEALSSNGYDVVLNSLPTPESIVSPSIVYSPLHGNLRDVERLRDLLEEQDLVFDLEPISSGNHFYTGINVGLYPTPFVPGRAREISIHGKELFGECPEVDATLALRKNLTFEADFIGWDETSQRETHKPVTGGWSQSSERVVLSVAGNDLLFELKRFSDSSDYALITGVRLRNMNDTGLLEQCDFVYSELDPR